MRGGGRGWGFDGAGKAEIRTGAVLGLGGVCNPGRATRVGHDPHLRLHLYIMYSHYGVWKRIGPTVLLLTERAFDAHAILFFIPFSQCVHVYVRRRNATRDVFPHCQRSEAERTRLYYLPLTRDAASVVSRFMWQELNDLRVNTVLKAFQVNKRR